MGDKRLLYEFEMLKPGGIAIPSSFETAASRGLRAA